MFFTFLCSPSVIWLFKMAPRWGAWVAQLVPLVTSAQVMILWSVSSSPAWGSVLAVQSLLGIPSPSLCPTPACSLSLSLSNKNKL